MKRVLIFHPFLFALFPVLFLFSHNIGELLINEVIGVIIITILFSLLFWLLLSFIFRDKRKAGLVTSLFLVLFFSYGHFYELINKMMNNKLENILVFHIGNLIIGPYKVLFFLWIIFLFSGTYFIIKTHKNLDNLTNTLNIISVCLVVSSLANIGIYNFKTKAILPDKKSMENQQNRAIDLETIKADKLPDIYYIILDAYASASTLKEYYNYDNSEFINYLTSKGFYVANKSCTNFPFTFLSLASSLNMEYINYLTDIVGASSDDKSIPYQMIRDSEVVRFLRKRGYKFILFASGALPATTYNPSADYTVSCLKWLNEFSTLLIDTTMAGPFLRRFLKQGDRIKMLNTFYYLPKIHRKFKGPKFIFAHIQAPHHPFVFGANGEPVRYHGAGDMVVHTYGDLRRFKQPYLNQLTFVNKKMKVVVDEILSESDIQPIIIIQADHGSAFSEGWNSLTERLFKCQMRIFNAYYLPGGGKKLLYDSVSPVNTFRIIFNYYFNTDYELLEDKSYFADPERQYDLFDVTNIVKYD